MTLAVVAVASFSIGAFGNQLVVQQIQSLSGSQVLVPAPELQILSSSWSINLNTSSIVAVILSVTTVGGTTTQFKLYQIFVQLSCLKGPLPGIPGTDFTCAVGTTTITLPTNMNGTSTIVKVPITPPIDPELIEVHNLSFIVTGSPTCTPSFTITARPSNVTINRAAGFLTANVTKTITGTCGFAGSIVFSSTTTPSGLTVVTLPTAISIPPSPATVFETISASSTTPPGLYTVVNCGTGGVPLITRCAIVTVNVV